MKFKTPEMFRAIILAFLLTVRSRAREDAIRNNPEMTFLQLIGFIWTYFQSMLAELAIEVSDEWIANLGHLKLTQLAEGEETLLLEANEVRSKREHLEQSLSGENYWPSIIKVCTGIFLCGLLFYAEGFLNSESLQLVTSTLLGSILLATVISIALLITVHYLHHLLVWISPVRVKRVIVAVVLSLVVACLISLMALRRVYQLELDQTQLSAGTVAVFTFVTTCIFLLASYMLFRFLIAPYLADIQEAIKNRRRKRKVNALCKAEAALNDQLIAMRANSIADMQVLAKDKLSVPHWRKLVRCCYVETIEAYRQAYLSNMRRGARLPDGFNDPIPPLDMEDN